MSIGGSSRGIRGVAACAAAGLAGLAGLALALPATSSGDASPRIVGGSTTTAANHPWQSALVINDAKFAGSDFARFLCGGSLITQRIVLTAAHCVVGTDPDPGDSTDLDADDVDVIVGRTTLTGSGGDELGVVGTYVTSAYSAATMQNDFAYIVLAAPSTQSRIDIADRNDGPAWQVNAATRVSGYGATSQGGPRSDTLKVATVPIISDTTCADPGVYGSAIFRDSMICAGFLAGGIDACQGDSGGPLQTAFGPPATRLVGIVSFGSGCAQPNSPGVYTRVAQNPICSVVVANLAQIEDLEGIPPGEREPVVGPAGCSDTRFVPTVKKSKCKKKKKKKGKKGVAAAKKCKKKKQKGKKKGNKKG